MKHALLITAYKELQQVLDLVDSFDEDFNCYVHLDKKGVYPDELRQLLTQRPRVTVCSLYIVNWGGLNHFMAVKHLMEVAMKDEQNGVFHIISGQDIRVCSCDDIKKFFRANEHKLFVETHRLPFARWGQEGGFGRVDYFYYMDCLNRMNPSHYAWLLKIVKLQRFLHLKRSRRHFPGPLYGGALWCSITREAVACVLDYLRMHPRFLRRMRNTFVPEEIIIPTLLMNSNLSDQVQHTHLRYVDWHYRNGSIPAFLDLADEEPIRKGNYLFARKIHPTLSSQLVKQFNL